MAIYEVLKDAGRALQEAGKIDLYNQILDVQEKLLDMQKHTHELERENQGLKNLLETQESLTYDNNAYWQIGDEKKDGPFCSRCWDAEHKVVRMQPCGNQAYFSCPNCTNKNVKIHHDPYDRPANPVYILRRNSAR